MIEQPREKPLFLYKITSMENWKKSADLKYLKLAKEDEAYIHLALKGQLGKIIEKYWNTRESFVVLKLEVCMLEGQLILEKNPGGVNKYYHLYQGSIPMGSIVEIELFK
jgi:uncharacterized protein (DUF952 family)